MRAYSWSQLASREFPQRDAAKRGLQVTVDDAPPVLTGSGSERRRCDELIQQVSDGGPSAAIQACPRFDDHALQGFLGLGPRAANRTRQTTTLAGDEVRVNGDLKAPSIRTT
jgi:hypothetical protein